MKRKTSEQEAATLATLVEQAKDLFGCVGNSGALATPATSATHVEDHAKIHHSKDAGYTGTVATPATLATQLEEYLDLLADFSPENSSDTPPSPPFEDPPERAKAWSAWWAALDRRNRKFTRGRFEPDVSPEEPPAVPASLDAGPNEVPPIASKNGTMIQPEQLDLLDFAE